MIPIDISARHIHLSEADIKTLLGSSATLTVDRPIAQPGQFVANERVALVGPRGRIEHVAIVGPTRFKTQVEVTVTEARTLGITPVFAVSGDQTKIPETLQIVGPAGTLTVNENVIVALRHLHIEPELATKFKLEHLGRVSIKVGGERAVVFENVVVRSRPGVDKLSFMLDTDEANAAGIKPGVTGIIVSQ